MQSNLVIANSRGPAQMVRYNREHCKVTCQMGQKFQQYFARYKHMTVIVITMIVMTLIVVTEFDCNLLLTLIMGVRWFTLLRSNFLKYKYIVFCSLWLEDLKMQTLAMNIFKIKALSFYESIES